MKHLIVTAALALAFSAFAEPPALTDIKVKQGGDKIVTIAYKLANEPAVVTVDIQTNAVAGALEGWASIGGENVYPTLSGDYSKVVDCGEGYHVITWKPRVSWLGHYFMNGTARAVLTAWPTNAPPKFMVVDLTNTVQRFTYYTDKSYLPGGITNRMYKTNKILLRRIPAAGITWQMGSTSTLDNRRNSNEDFHPVTLTEDYYMAVYETTCQQHNTVKAYAKATFKDFLEWSGWGSDTGWYYPSTGQGNYEKYYDEDTAKMCPVCGTYYTFLRGKDGSLYNWPVNGHNVVSNGFFGALRSMTGNAVLFDLPTEAQWEFAARAGTETETYFGKVFSGWSPNKTLLNANAWTWYNSEVGSSGVRLPHAVGLKTANNFDLYDVIGNVGEACLDQYQDSLGTVGVVDPIGPTTGELVPNRVHRGGACCGEEHTGRYNNRSAYRASLPQSTDSKWSHHRFGFRIWAPAVAK